jgi:hypothetical protein
MGFDFSAVVAPFRMQPGLRRIAPGVPHLTPNRLDDRALREKLSVLSHHREQAFVAAPTFDPAGAIGTLAAHAASEHPDAFVRHSDDAPALAADGAFEARHLGWSLRNGRFEGSGPAEIGACLQALPPAWRLTGLLSLAFAEDFAILDASDGRIPWLAVCLPSSWSPSDKVGRQFAEVHAPVADNDVLIAASDHLIRLVTGGDRWERFVWTLSDSPTLDRHPARSAPSRWDASLSADRLAAATYFRSERQTFIPVASTRLAIFTIHVEVRPLRSVVTSAADASRLQAALATMSPEVLAYRGLAPARDRLLAWLAAMAATA